jgi:murein DD-endopeptidase MepM/ murein hydrolase activator NlpD
MAAWWRCPTARGLGDVGLVAASVSTRVRRRVFILPAVPALWQLSTIGLCPQGGRPAPPATGTLKRMPSTLLFTAVLLAALLPAHHSSVSFRVGHRAASNDAILAHRRPHGQDRLTGLPAPPNLITTSPQAPIAQSVSFTSAVGSASSPARARVAGRRVAPAGTGFAWPVIPASVVRRFDPPPRPWLPGHRGVDLAAPPSVVVHSAGAGTVVYAGVLAGRGVVSVAHSGGLRTTYEPIHVTVAAGDVVPLGGELGTLDPGHAGCPAAACLHWGLRRGDLYLDPLALLGLGRVRLLPLDNPTRASPGHPGGADQH